MHCYGLSWELHKILQWRHNERDGVPNHRCLDCLLSRLFRRRSKNISKLCVTALYEGNPPVAGGFPHTGQVTRNWWRHHAYENSHTFTSGKLFGLSFMEVCFTGSVDHRPSSGNGLVPKMWSGDDPMKLHKYAPPGFSELPPRHLETVGLWNNWLCDRLY